MTVYGELLFNIIDIMLVFIQIILILYVLLLDYRIIRDYAVLFRLLGILLLLVLEHIINII